MNGDTTLQEVVAAIAGAEDKQGMLTMTMANDAVIEVEVRILSAKMEGEPVERYNNPVGMYE